MNLMKNGIYGYFEIIINDQVLGFCPDGELLAGEEWDEDITYWLAKLSKGIIQLNSGQEYEIQLLSMNLAKIVLEKKEELIICFEYSDTNEVIWSEKVVIQEWCKEVMLNIERFIAKMQSINPALIEAKLIKELIDIKNLLSATY